MTTILLTASLGKVAWLIVLLPFLALVIGAGIALLFLIAAAKKWNGH